jgi:tetratricopeptide (TPR) repeat protein
LAQKNYFQIPESELKLLPPFCRTGLTGQDWGGTNHLCPGLYALNDAQRTFGNDSKRNYALQEAIDHLDYTVNHTTPAFPYRATVLIKRGNAFELQGNRSKAIADYNAAVTLQPNNLLGYLSLCNAYVKIGDKNSARQAADKGLQVRPDAKPLVACKQKASEN